jgi:hypothetical protein
MQGEYDRPRRAYAVIYGWYTRQPHDCGHRVEMMSGVDDIGPERQLLKIGCYRN